MKKWVVRLGLLPIVLAPSLVGLALHQQGDMIVLVLVSVLSAVFGLAYGYLWSITEKED